MKVQEILNEFIVSDTGDKQELVHLIKTKYLKNFLYILDNPEDILWRGFQNGSFQTYDNSLYYREGQSPKSRISRTGNSFMNILQANDPAWAEFPDRNKSIYCTTFQRRTETFGSPTFVIPADSVRGFGSISDDWNDIKLGEGNRKHKIAYASTMINYFAEKLLKLRNFYVGTNLSFPELDKILDEKVLEACASNIENYNYDDVKRLITMFDQIVKFRGKDLHDIKIVDSLMNEISYVSADIIDTFGSTPSEWFKNFTPENMGCELVHSYRSGNFFDTEKNEVWFSGDYLQFTFKNPDNMNYPLSRASFKDLVSAVTSG